MLILRGKSFALSAGGRVKPANRFYACLGARSGKMSLGKCRYLWPNQTGWSVACGHADGVLRPFGRQFAVFCCVKDGLSGGGKHVFGARKRCFAAADMVFSAVNTVKKTLKRRILLHKTPLCAVTSAMSGSYVCTRFLPVFVPGGLLFFNGGLLTLQGNSMCKPPGRCGCIV